MSNFVGISLVFCKFSLISNVFINFMATKLDNLHIKQLRKRATSRHQFGIKLSVLLCNKHLRFKLFCKVLP